MKQLVDSFYGWYRGGLRHPQYRWLIIFGTLAYLLSPIDISPDVFPIVGWIDDGILITLLIAEVTQLLQGALNRNGDEEPAADEAVREDDDTVVVDVDAQEVP
ncbi:YkvA family protein [Leptothoe sp. PORK10 BA2]|uniref:YkvA family protein n=1 Tax=Leptothoe sp. PORK10 BA2 TaxID=3110254 RepID=UPI002B21F119|nr:YkvA family protein [Leptothoe sp. PORK10 BA2]MEA5463144.1 YkvA family protein [Leptothoe sp. PORK10 BA2]